MERVGAQIDAATGGVELFARIMDTETASHLRPGAFVEVAIPDQSYGNVVHRFRKRPCIRATLLTQWSTAGFSRGGSRSLRGSATTFCSTAKLLTANCPGHDPVGNHGARIAGRDPIV